MLFAIPVAMQIGRHGEGMWREEVMSLSRLLADYMAPCNTQDVRTSRCDVNLYKCVYVGPFFKYDFSLIENLYMCLLNTEIFLSPYEWVCSS